MEVVVRLEIQIAVGFFTITPTKGQLIPQPGDSIFFRNGGTLLCNDGTEWEKEGEGGYWPTGRYELLTVTPVT